MIDHFSAFEFELVALFLTLPLKNGWQGVKTARKLNLGGSRSRVCDFLADPDSRSFSRFGAIIMQVAVSEYVSSPFRCVGTGTCPLFPGLLPRQTRDRNQETGWYLTEMFGRLPLSLSLSGESRRRAGAR